MRSVAFQSHSVQPHSWQARLPRVIGSSHLAQIRVLLRPVIVCSLADKPAIGHPVIFMDSPSNPNETKSNPDGLNLLCRFLTVETRS